MNRLELKTILEVLGIDELDEPRRNKLGRAQITYKWNNLRISSGKYRAVIEGKIPYRVAKLLAKKYGDEISCGDIRADGMYLGQRIKPESFYLKDKEGNSFVGVHDVYTKEALVHLLTEVDYYHKTGGVYTEELRRKFQSQQRALLNEINERLIKCGNPYISSEEWYADHNFTAVGENEDALTVLPFVKAFDGAVNPFSNEDYEMKSPEEYTDTVKLTIDADQYNNGLNMSISKDDVELSHIRTSEIDYDENNLSYTACYELAPDRLMTVSHVASLRNKTNFVRVYEYERYSPLTSHVSLKYDLVSNSVSAAYDDNESAHPITKEEKDLLLDRLKQATKVASSVTLQNMAKPLVQKTYQK